MKTPTAEKALQEDTRPFGRPRQQPNGDFMSPITDLSHENAVLVVALMERLHDEKSYSTEKKAVSVAMRDASEHIRQDEKSSVLLIPSDANTAASTVRTLNELAADPVVEKILRAAEGKTYARLSALFADMQKKPVYGPEIPSDFVRVVHEKKPKRVKQSPSAPAPSQSSPFADHVPASGPHEPADIPAILPRSELLDSLSAAQ